MGEGVRLLKRVLSSPTSLLSDQGISKREEREERGERGRVNLCIKYLVCSPSWVCSSSLAAQSL